MGRGRTAGGATLRTVEKVPLGRPSSRVVAVDYARSRGAPAIEGYPVDNQGKKVDLTMAYVGTRVIFERAGFTRAADTDSVSGGFPRVVMRLHLAQR